MASLGELEFGIRDNDREIGKVGIHTGAVTALTLPALLTQVGTMRTALTNITLGIVASESLSVFNTKLSALAPADKLAQRGIKWTVGYSDNQQNFDFGQDVFSNYGYGKLFTLQIPCADLSLLKEGSDEADMENAFVEAFVTAFEAMARSPYGGTVNVEYIRYVD